MADERASTAAPLVLVVDDEPQIRRFLKTGFELQGFRIVEAGTAREALEVAVMRKPDLVVLDLGLPDADGASVLEQLRGWFDGAVIVLSVRNAETDKVALLEKGADDYVVKPFGMAELLARARVVLRRVVSRGAPEPVLRVGALALDFAQRIVTLNGAPVTLSPKQFALLRALGMHHGKVLTHRQLMKELWPQDPDEDVQYLRILMKKLRDKLEPDPARPVYLVTELAIGYRLRTQEQLDLTGYAEVMP